MTNSVTSGERLVAGVSPRKTFYPVDYVPSWWACDECRTLWHDAWEDHTELGTRYLVWNVASLCDGDADRHHTQDEMRKVSDETAADLYRNGYTAAEGRSVKVVNA